MARKTVTNATTSINYWLDTVLKPAIKAEITPQVCFYYEENQKLTYPCVFVDHFVQGASSNLQKYNIFSINVFTFKSNDLMAWGFQDVFFNTTGFTSESVNQIKMIPMLDWTDKNNPVQYACVRLYLPSGNGFIQQGDKDKEIRHYRLDVEAYYY